jgi:hypothetical protein
MRSVQQKGAAIRSTLQAVANLHGDAALTTIKERLPPAIRAQIEPRVLPVAWYPVAVAAAIHDAIRVVVGDGHWKASHALGVEAARIDFTGVYRIFLRSMQYDTMWERAQRAWSSYNSQGEVRWVDPQPGHLAGIVTGVSGFNLGMWEAVGGRLEGLVTMSGARGAAVEVKEHSTATCRFDAMWLE